MKGFSHDVGMTYSELIGHTKIPTGDISKDKSPDWFDRHANSDIEGIASIDQICINDLLNK